MITSFSGSHPYQPQCWITQILTGEPDADRDEAARFVEVMTARIGDGRCPRCGGPLPTPPVRPSGSRVTSCRCVPICGPCGEHETLPMGLVGQADPDGEDDREEDGWILDPVQRDADLAALRERFSVGIISGDVLVSDDGAAPITLRPRPGGWAEHGYDDTSDTAERQR